MAGLVASGAAMMPSDPSKRMAAPVSMRPFEAVPAAPGADLDAEDVIENGEAGPG